MSTEAAAIKANESSPSFWIIIGIIFFGSFVGMYHVVSLNVSLPGFMGVFDASLQEVQWIVTSFMLTCGLIAPLSGFLIERFGIKHAFQFTLIGITVTSLLCGMSWSIGSLIIFRALQGLFCGLISPITLAMVYQLIPERRQVMALSIWSFSTILGTSIGPTLSGWLQSYNWHLIFMTTIPLGIIVIILAGFILEREQGDASLGFDWFGLLLASTASAALLLMFGNLNVWGWSHPWTWLLMITGAGSSLLFVFYELRKKQPLLQLRLLTNGLFMQSLLMSLLLAFALHSGIYFVPLFLEEIHEMSAFEIGLVFLPASLSLTIATFLSGRLYNTKGPILLVLLGSCILFVTTLLLGFISATTSLLTITLILTIRNFGTGLSMTPLTNVSMSSVTPQERAHASALVNWLRQLFSAIIIGIFTSFFNARQHFYSEKWDSLSMIANKLQYVKIYTSSHRDSFLLAGLFLLLVFPLTLKMQRNFRVIKQDQKQ